MTQNDSFANLSNINMTDAIKKKEGARDKKTGEVKILDYIPWAQAWRELKSKYPDATFKLWRDEDGIPFIETSGGLMVFTEVTVQGLTLGMHLPVLDYRNNSVKPDDYTMNDVNKAIMRCLVKNIALHGLGINIYIGEEFSEDGTAEQSEATKKKIAAEGRKADLEAELDQIIAEQNLNTNKTKAGLGLINSPTLENYQKGIEMLKNYIANNYDLSCWR